MGRLLGEGLAHASTNGVSSQGTACAINPGGYALAGKHTVYPDRPQTNRVLAGDSRGIARETGAVSVCVCVCVCHR